MNTSLQTEKHSREQMGNAASATDNSALDTALESSDARITFGRAVGFGLGDFFGGGQLTLVGTYMVLFWTKFCHISIGTAQTIVGLSALISAMAALFFGILDDNLYRFRLGLKFGRRRFMLMILSPLILVGMLLWVPGLPLAAYFLTYVLWIMLVQLFAAAYNPLPGEMTLAFTGRTKLSTIRLFISNGAGMLILVAGGVILSIFGESKPTGYMLLAMGTTVLFSLALLICWHFTWEMTPAQAGFGQYVNGDVDSIHIGFAGWSRRLSKTFTEYVSTLKLAVFRQHLAIYLLVQVASDVFGQVFVFFVIYDWSRTAAFASLLLASGTIALPLMPLFGYALTKIGPKRLYAIGFAGSLTALAWMFVAWQLVEALPEPYWTMFVWCGSLLFFSFKALCGYLPWAIFPFIPDVDQVVSQRYRSSTFSGMQACLRQLGSGVVTMGVGLILTLVHFDAKRHWQPTSARLGLAGILFGWFALSMVVCWLVSRRLTLSEKTDHMVLAEIARIRVGGQPQDVDPQSRQAIEQLTGMPYGRHVRESLT